MSLRRFLHRRQWDEERVREVEAHLAEEIDDNRARGMTPQEARRRAYIKFGNPTVIREEIWQMKSLVLIENLGRDLRYAMRQLFRSPGFAVIAILTLGLGIGVNTAIFSITNSLFFSSLHIRDEGRVAEIGFEQKGDSWQPGLSMPEYRELQDGSSNVFSELIGERVSLDGLSAQGSKPDRILSSYVTGNYFQTLGVEPLLGQLFGPSEGVTPGSDPVMVLMSVLSTCVTKQTKDMVYSEARRLWFLSSEQFRTILNALEREPDHGSTSAVLGQLSKRRDVRSGPMSRLWNLASHSISLDQPL